MPKSKELSYQNKSRGIVELSGAILHALSKVISHLFPTDIFFLVANKGLWKEEVSALIRKIFEKYSIKNVSLYALLKKNSSADSSLTSLEEKQARFLIWVFPKSNGKKCSICGTKKAIHDTDLCQKDAKYVFNSQK